MMSAIKTFLQRFKNDTRGSIILVAAFVSTSLIALGGSAYDFGIQQMAYKNGQQAADMAATSAAGSRLSEYWGRGSNDAGVEHQQELYQEALAAMYFDINSRGYDIDPNFQLTKIDVVKQGDIYKTVIQGGGKIPSKFVKLVGVDTLSYDIDTVTNLRNPGEQPVYDMVMLLDFTKSMEKPMAGCGSGAACTRAAALQRASTFLNNVVMCGNESGEACLGKNENKNRLGVIAYGLTAVGLDPCDLAPSDPNRPESCKCVMPRGSEYTGTQEDWTNNNQDGWGLGPNGQIVRGEPGMPDNPCRPTCSWIDANGKPASDPYSDVFNCSCFDRNNPNDPWDIPPNPNALVGGSGCAQPPSPSAMHLLNYPPKLAQCSWLNFCNEGGCCPPKCLGRVVDGQPCSQHVDGTRACAQCQVNKWPHADKCGCAQPTGAVNCTNDNGTPENPADDKDCSMVKGPTPTQTYKCHHQSCTCSCTASGGPTNYPPCTPGSDPENPCNPQNPTPPWPPGGSPNYGQNGVTPQAEFAQAVGMDENTLFSAVYKPAENEGKLIKVAGPGAWASYSLAKCKDDANAANRNEACQDGVQNSINGEPKESDTNSASAFEAFEAHQTYLKFMRPNNEPDDQDQESVNVVVWVSDGENTKFQYPYPATGQTPPTVIPKEERIDVDGDGNYEPADGDRMQRAGTLASPGPDWDAVKNNCYDGGGTYKVRDGGATTGPCPGYSVDSAVGSKTAQGWSDFYTLQRCRKYREGTWVTSGGQPRPVTIYTVYVHDGSDAQALAHTRELMSTCSYGVAVGGSEAPPAGQQKLFFSVTTVAELNRTFRTITNSLGRIRIVD